MIHLVLLVMLVVMISVHGHLISKANIAPFCHIMGLVMLINLFYSGVSTMSLTLT